MLKLALRILRKSRSTQMLCEEKVFIEDGSENACNCKHGDTDEESHDDHEENNRIAHEHREEKKKNSENNGGGRDVAVSIPRRDVTREGDKCGLWRYSFHLSSCPF